MGQRLHLGHILKAWGGFCIESDGFLPFMNAAANFLFILLILSHFFIQALILSYVQGLDYISITAEVRELARSVVTVDFTDAEIIRYQYMRYSQIRTVTQKDDWLSTDREFGALQLIETKLAASDIMEHYGTPQDVAMWQAIRESAMSELKQTVDYMSTSTSSGASTTILETSYKSWNLNSDVASPNRLNNSNVGEGVETVTLTEPDF